MGLLRHVAWQQLWPLFLRSSTLALTPAIPLLRNTRQSAHLGAL